MRGPCVALRSGCTLHHDFVAMNHEQLELLVTRVMPYGKYKGRVIADLPGHYLNWFASQGFPPGEIGRLIALMHEIDHNGLKPLLEPLRKAKSQQR
ncbi:conserved hypothetical protein [Burkholderia sp. H160]|nr:conserved hypothetical protein [Burkholderia sp. H160]